MRGNPYWPHDRAIASVTISSMLTTIRAMPPVYIKNLTFKKTEEILKKDAQMKAYVSGEISGFVDGIKTFKQLDAPVLEKFSKISLSHTIAKARYYNFSHREHLLHVATPVISGLDAVDLIAAFCKPVLSKVLNIDVGNAITCLEVAHWKTSEVKFTKKEPTCVECVVSANYPRLLYGVTIALTDASNYNANKLDAIYSEIATANVQVIACSYQILSLFLDHKDVLEKYKTFVERTALIIGALSVTHLPFAEFIELDNLIYKNFDSKLGKYVTLLEENHHMQPFRIAS